VQASQPITGQPVMAQPLPPYTFRATITLAVPEICPDWHNHVNLSFTAAAPGPPAHPEYHIFNLEPGFRYGPASQTVNIDFQLAFYPGPPPPHPLGSPDPTPSRRGLGYVLLYRPSANRRNQTKHRECQSQGA